MYPSHVHGPYILFLTGIRTPLFLVLSRKTTTSRASPRSPAINLYAVRPLRTAPSQLIRPLQLITNAVTFTLVHDGIPIIYAGQEHQFSGRNDPHNREALWHSGFSRDSPHYRLISKLNAFRAAMPHSYFTDKARVIHIAPPHTFALRKGSAVSILTNIGARSDRQSITLAKGRTGWIPGSWVADVLSCYITRVMFNGETEVRIANGKPRVLYPLLELHEMGFCRDVAVPVIGWVEIFRNWMRGWSWWGVGAAALGWKMKEL